MESLVFFGNEQLSSSRSNSKYTILQGLIDKGYSIETLIIKDALQRSRQPRKQKVVQIAEQNNIPIIRVSSSEELLYAVNKTTSSIAVLAAFGIIIPQVVIDHFEHGIINIHPSLLPLYRGTTPIETAILDGIGQTGVSVMSLTAKMDSGPIYATRSLTLHKHVRKSDLTDKLNELGSALLVETLPHILKGSLASRPQDESKATYTKMLNRQQDSVLDSKHSAVVLERQIRAYADWPASTLTINDVKVTILEADLPTGTDLNLPKLNGYLLIDRQKGELLLLCNDGSKLRLNQLKHPGGKPLDARSFINGYIK